MKRFILSEEPFKNGMIKLSDKDYHYLVRVRRFKAGDIFNAFLPSGIEVKVRVDSITEKELLGHCLPLETKEETLNLTPIVLFQGLPKASKMDLIVRQATEAGISEIIPFTSEYSMPKQEFKIERWNKIIKEARQQSGSSISTLIKSPCDLDNVSVYWENLKSRYSKSVGIVLHQDYVEDGSFHSYLNSDPYVVVLVVGPEGGFSSNEIKRFLSIGFKALTLGPNILRCETAVLYVTAVVRIILLESKSWILKNQ